MWRMDWSLLYERIYKKAPRLPPPLWGFNHRRLQNDNLNAATKRAVPVIAAVIFPECNQQHRDCTSVLQLGLSKLQRGFLSATACLIMLIGRCLWRSRGREPTADALCKAILYRAGRCFLPATQPYISISQRRPREFFLWFFHCLSHGRTCLVLDFHLVNVYTNCSSAV